MKKIITFCLSVSLLLAGCRKSAVEPVPQIPIALGTAVTATKAPIAEGQDMTISVVGWEVAQGLKPEYSAQNWYSISEVRASQTAKVATLNPVQYYHPQAEYRTFIKASYPKGTMDGKGVIVFDDTDDLRSGKVDVMIAGAVVGSKTDTGVKNLEFRHLLSQIKFQITAAPGSYSTQMTLRSLKIQDAQLASGIDFKGDTVVPFAAQNLAIGGDLNKAFVINTVSGVGDPVMIKPFEGNKFTAIAQVELSSADGKVTSLEIPNIRVVLDNDQTFKAGTAYTITLRRSGEDYLEVRMVKVADWQDVGAGSVPVPI